MIVAPSEPTYSFNRVVAAHQLYARKAEPVLVRSINEAYDTLGIVAPAFSPIGRDRAYHLDAILHDVLSRVPEALRAHSLRDATAGAIVLGVAGRRLTRPVGGPITLSDVFNAALRAKVLRDPLIRALCRDCGAGLPLHCMSISAGRVTTYSCPVCNGWIVKFSQIDGTLPVEASGYVVGSFEVLSRVGLDILGVHLRATET